MTSARPAPAALLAVLALTVTLDLATKAWASQTLRGEPRPRSLVGTLLQLDYRENFGVVFGMLSSHGARPGLRAALIGLGAFGVVALAALLVRSLRAGAPALLAWAVALACAGAAGNFADRAARGYVIDFIVLGYHGARWPTFNVADVAISVAVVLGVISLSRDRRARALG